MNPFIGQLQPFGCNFAPRGWAFCNGQLLDIASNTALFSLLGTFYGGDGRTSFGLPDLRGRLPIHQGRGPGLSEYRIGTKGGIETVTLNLTQIPSHQHSLATASATPAASTASGTQGSPIDAVHAAHGDDEDYAANANATMAAGNISGSLAPTGGSQAHENRAPFLALNWCIALQGVYPSRS